MLSASLEKKRLSLFLLSTQSRLFLLVTKTSKYTIQVDLDRMDLSIMTRPKMGTPHEGCLPGTQILRNKP